MFLNTPPVIKRLSSHLAHGSQEWSHTLRDKNLNLLIKLFQMIYWLLALVEGNNPEIF